MVKAWESLIDDARPMKSYHNAPASRDCLQNAPHQVRFGMHYTNPTTDMIFILSQSMHKINFKYYYVLKPI